MLFAPNPEEVNKPNSNQSKEHNQSKSKTFEFNDQILNQNFSSLESNTPLEKAIKSGASDLSVSWSASLKFIFKESLRNNKLNFAINLLCKISEKLVPYGMWSGIGLALDSVLTGTSFQPAKYVLLSTAVLSFAQTVLGPYFARKYEALQSANLNEAYYKAIPNYRTQELGTDFLSREQIIARDHYYSLAEFVNNSFSVLNSAAAFTLAFVSIYPANKLVAAAMFLTMLPRIWAQIAYANDFAKLVDKLADSNRQFEYLDWMYVDNKQIIEVKSLQQTESIMKKTMGCLMKRVNANLLNYWSHLKRSLLVEGFEHAITYTGIFILINQVYNNPASLAQSLLPFYALSQFRDEMIGFTSTLGEQANHMPFIRRIVGFMTNHSNDEYYSKQSEKIDWKSGAPELRLENVTVKHLGVDQPALTNVSLTIKPGTVLAVLGEIGSGKSTLVGAIEGRYRLAAGSVYANEHDIRNIRQELRTHTRRLDQSFCLFESLTFREILEMGLNPFKSDNVQPAVEELSKETGLHDILIKKPAGYDTHNGEGLGKFSSKLSGGQAQLLALTRTILGNPEIVILDEPTASLDASRSQELEEFIIKYLKGKTIILVTHSMSTAYKLSDQIIWLEAGELKESGTPNDLLKLENGHFRKMFELQKSGFESE